jgi:ubiquinone/menaquinone biosynthesis C-methylase UbiE
MISQWNHIDDAEYLRSTQYGQAHNLQARLDVLNRYRSHPIPWYVWLFEHLQLPPTAAILEVGCGLGNLWTENLTRIPAQWNIIVSDFSPGMLAATQQHLATRLPAGDYAVLDLQALPFPAACFDAVIANHMLYHVPDRPRALADVQRVLKPGGRLYASTVGQQHLHELADIVERFDSNLALWNGWPMESFVIENGQAQLAPWLTDLRLDRYTDPMTVDQAQGLAAYVLSSTAVPKEQQHAFQHFVEAELQRQGGRLQVTKEFGLFSGVRRRA